MVIQRQLSIDQPVILNSQDEYSVAQTPVIRKDFSGSVNQTFSKAKEPVHIVSSQKGDQKISSNLDSAKLRKSTNPYQ